jgi:hypothetical protein
VPEKYRRQPTAQSFLRSHPNLRSWPNLRSCPRQFEFHRGHIGPDGLGDMLDATDRRTAVAICLYRCRHCADAAGEIIQCAARLLPPL